MPNNTSCQMGRWPAAWPARNGGLRFPAAAPFAHLDRSTVRTFSHSSAAWPDREFRHGTETHSELPVFGRCQIREVRERKYGICK
jgi:hypothetical protein